MAYSSPYTQKSGSTSLHSVPEENEDVPPPPPPHPYFFVFPEQIFGGWPYYTSGSQSQGRSFNIRNTYNRRSWGPDSYFEYGNGNGNGVMRTRHHSTDDLDGTDSFTQYENTGNNLMSQANNGWACFKVFLFLLAVLFVFCAVALFAMQLQSYCESSANVDNVSNFQGGKAYCTCECEDLLELFTLRSFYQTQEQLNSMMQRKIGRRD